MAACNLRLRRWGCSAASIAERASRLPAAPPRSAARMVGDDQRNGYCMRSCGVCDGSGDTLATCADFADDCAWWRDNGHCGKNEYVKVYCAAACGACEQVVIDDTAGVRSTCAEPSWVMGGRGCWRPCSAPAPLPRPPGCRAAAPCWPVRAPARPTHRMARAGGCYDNDAENCAYWAGEGYCEAASD